MKAFIKKYWHLNKIKDKKTETIKLYGSDNTLLAEVQLSKKELKELKSLTKYSSFRGRND